MVWCIEVLRNKWRQQQCVTIDRKKNTTTHCKNKATRGKQNHHNDAQQKDPTIDQIKTKIQDHGDAQ